MRTTNARFDASGTLVAVPPDRRRENALVLPPLRKPSALRFLDPIEAELHQMKLYQEL